MDSQLSVRAFFAIELDHPARQGVLGYIEALQKEPDASMIRWVSEENLHITTRFLGNINYQQVDELQQQIAAKIQVLPAFKMEFGSVLLFPSRRPHVLIVDIKISSALQQLFHTVEQGVLAIGLPPETRPFSPHLTLGRMRTRKAPLFPCISSLLPINPLDVNSIVLYQSESSPQGVRYNPLVRFPLDNPGPKNPP